MLKVVVGSRNPVKVNSVRNVFLKFFQDLEVVGEDVGSKVSVQPRTEEETLEGARSRADQVFERFRPDFSVGVEGGIQRIGDNIFSFAWVCIKSKDGLVGLGRTASFPVPRKVMELVEGGLEMGEANDLVFKVEGSKQRGGLIGHLSKGKLDRTGLNEQGVVCALLPFLNKELY